MRPFKKTIILLLTLILAACNSANPEYITSLEQLKDTLTVNGENLSFDITPFQIRVEEINSNLIKLKNDLEDTLSLEDGIAFDKYKGVMKIYKRNIQLYSTCKQEQEQLEKQINNLLDDINSGKITDQEFKEYFELEKIDVQKLVEQTALIKSSTYEIEPEFRRLSQFVYSKLQKDSIPN